MPAVPAWRVARGACEPSALREQLPVDPGVRVVEVERPPGVTVAQVLTEVVALAGRVVVGALRGRQLDGAGVVGAADELPEKLVLLERRELVQRIGSLQRRQRPDGCGWLVLRRAEPATSAPGLVQMTAELRPRVLRQPSCLTRWCRRQQGPRF